LFDRSVNALDEVRRANTGFTLQEAPLGGNEMTIEHVVEIVVVLVVIYFAVRFFRKRG
jgi:hypothetical protein